MIPGRMSKENSVKLAICQINTTVADFSGNCKKILDGLKAARQSGADLVLFPELATTGYPPRDLLDKPHFVAKNLEVVSSVAAATKNGPAAIFGFVARNKSATGRPLFNGAAVACDGKIVFEQYKRLLPVYDVFEEERHFESAATQKIWEWKGIRWGISICEDIWGSHDFDGRRLYSEDPIQALKEQGAQAIINISASPFSLGQAETRKKLLEGTAKKFQLPIFYCNLVGGNDELIFDGRSLVVDQTGATVCEAASFQEDFLLCDWNLKLPPLKRGEKICSPVEEVYEALLLGLKDYLRKCGFQKVVIGLSGGVDSALVAVLAAKALGPENVLGVLMPSRYSSQGSLEDALALAKNLKISTRTISVDTIYASYLNLLQMNVEKEIPLAAENIQARIRGNLLMAISNQEGALVLSTGNKSEISVGYCTLYGDMAGGLAVISDLPKTMVYALTRWLNEKEKLIPESILTKAPSAELKPNQKDQDTLPAYEVLDGILKAYIEEHKDAEAMIKIGFDPKTVREVIARIDRNEYKRRQMPPGLKVTSKAFGMGRRFPIARKFV